MTRLLLFCATFAFASISSPVAMGLTVGPEWERDWSVELRDYRFGVQETEWGWTRTTTIYWGGGSIETSWPLWAMIAAAVGALAATIAVAGLAFAIFARRSNRKGEATDYRDPHDPRDGGSIPEASPQKLR